MWKPPNQRKDPSRLLFDEKPERVPPIINNEKSHYYHISQSVFDADILPSGYECMRLTKISEDHKPLLYRLSIWYNEPKKGLRIWKSYTVSIAGDTEFVFNPPISNDIEDNGK